MFSISDKAKYITIFVLAALLLAGAAFHQRTVRSLEGQIAAMEIMAQQAEIEALDRQREIEHEWQEKADTAAAATASGLAAIERSYSAALERFDVDGVRADGAGGGAAALPAAAATAPGAGAAGTCGCSGAHSKSVRRELLTIARDCDITAARYNELLRLWQGVTGQGGVSVKTD